MNKLMPVMLLAGLTLSAAGLVGKWRGTLEVTTSEGDVKTDQAYMDFKVDGTKVTGTVSSNPDHPFAIQNGKLEGGKLTFEANMGDPVGFELVLDGDTLRGSATATAGGAKMSAKVEMKRVR